MLTPQEVIAGRRQLVAVRTKLEGLAGAVVVEIAFDQPILEHSTEGDAGASGRPGELAGQCEIAEQQDQRSGHDAQAAPDQRSGAELRWQPAEQHPARTTQTEQHPPCRAMGRCRERGEHEQKQVFQFRIPITVDHEEIERQNRQAGKNVGQQQAGQHRERCGQAQPEHDGRPLQRMSDIEHT